MPVEFLYTAGTAGERFFQTLRKRGRFEVTRCDECNLTYCPPRAYCERCFADLSDSWKEALLTGRVHTFTIVHVDGQGRPLPQPEVVAYVRVDGTDGGFVTKLLRVKPGDVQLEMPVAAVLAPPRKRRGNLSDLLGFTPTK